MSAALRRWAGRGLLVGLAALAGWAGHRVYTRVSSRLAVARATQNQPAAPLADRAERKAFAFVPDRHHSLGDAVSGVPERSVRAGGFWIGRAEVTCGAYAEFLNDTRRELPPSPQFVREGPAWQAVRPAYAVTGVSLADARSYAQWFGARRGCRGRLPRADEWEAAARGGVVGAPFAWGWGDPSGRTAFARSAPERTAWYPAHGYGLFDASGGVAEWCEPGPDDPPGTAAARGGSWADRDPAQLQVGRLTRLPVDYRDADVGFRIVIEPLAVPVGVDRDARGGQHNPPHD